MEGKSKTLVTTGRPQYVCSCQHMLGSLLMYQPGCSCVWSWLFSPTRMRSWHESTAKYFICGVCVCVKVSHKGKIRYQTVADLLFFKALKDLYTLV